MSTDCTLEVKKAGKNRRIETINVVSQNSDTGRITSQAQITDVIDTLKFRSRTLNIDVEKGSAQVSIDIPPDFKQGPRIN